MWAMVRGGDGVSIEKSKGRKTCIESGGAGRYFEKERGEAEVSVYIERGEGDLE